MKGSRPVDQYKSCRPLQNEMFKCIYETWTKKLVSEEKERSKAGWQSWREVRTAVQDRNRWRTIVQALCANLAPGDTWSVNIHNSHPLWNKSWLINLIHFKFTCGRRQEALISGGGGTDSRIYGTISFFLKDDQHEWSSQSERRGDVV